MVLSKERSQIPMSSGMGVAQRDHTALTLVMAILVSRLPPPQASPARCGAIHLLRGIPACQCAHPRSCDAHTARVRHSTARTHLWFGFIVGYSVSFVAGATWVRLLPGTETPEGSGIARAESATPVPTAAGACQGPASSGSPPPPQPHHDFLSSQHTFKVTAPLSQIGASGTATPHGGTT